MAELGDTETVALAYERVNREGSAVGAARGEPVALPPPVATAHTAAPLGERARRLWEVTAAVAVADFRKRYLDSALSYLWALMRPLAFFAVLWVVFTQVGSFDAGVDHYPLYLLTAIVLWTFFSESTHTAVGSLVQRAPLLRTLPVPRVAIPLSVALTSLLDLCMTLIAVLAIILASGIEPRVDWLELPVLIALLTLLVTGCGMLLSVLYVRLRDVDHVWHVVRQTLFYLSPIIYVASFYPDSIEEAAMVNPLAAIFTEARHALIDPGAPTAAAAIGGSARLLAPLGLTLRPCSRSGSGPSAGRARGRPRGCSHQPAHGTSHLGQHRVRDRAPVVGERRVALAAAAAAASSPRSARARRVAATVSGSTGRPASMLSSSKAARAAPIMPRELVARMLLGVRLGQRGAGAPRPRAGPSRARSSRPGQGRRRCRWPSSSAKVTGSLTRH